MDISISEWRDAEIEASGETLFAIGDVHGCLSQFALLLNEISHQAERLAKSRLIFLGDLISKGPSILGVLDMWAADTLAEQHSSVHRLFGNHEQMLMIIANGLPNSDDAKQKLFSVGGKILEEELRQKAGEQSALLSRELLHAGTSAAVMSKLDRLQSHIEIGNLVFVHGGIDPALGVAASLAPSWEEIADNHWAWIQGPFLQHRGDYGGRLIVHGHTPPASHRKYTGYPDPHVIQHSRLCLDGGSSVTGIVMAAQIEDGRYRLIAAHN
jgi:serine/threonine protein phosphatase 1